MTKAEMTKIFSVMMLAYPNSKMFEGGIPKLKPTIELWTTCLPDVDFWTGQQAVVLLCRECKYPPTIAEFHEKAEAVIQEIEGEFRNHISRIRSAEFLYGSLERFFTELPEGHLKKSIEMIGGPNHLVKKLEDGTEIWDWDNLHRAFIQTVRAQNLPGGSVKLLPYEAKEN